MLHALGIDDPQWRSLRQGDQVGYPCVVSILIFPGADHAACLRDR